MPDYGRYDREDTRSRRSTGRSGSDNAYRVPPRNAADSENKYDAYRRSGYRRSSYRNTTDEYRRTQPRGGGGALNRPGDREVFSEERNTYVHRTSESEMRRLNMRRPAEARTVAGRTSAQQRSNRRPAAQETRRPAHQPEKAKRKPLKKVNIAELFMRVPRWGRLAVFAVLILALLAGSIVWIVNAARKNETRDVMVPGSVGQLTPAATDVPAEPELSAEGYEPAPTEVPVQATAEPDNSLAAEQKDVPANIPDDDGFTEIDALLGIDS